MLINESQPYWCYNLPCPVHWDGVYVRRKDSQDSSWLKKAFVQERAYHDVVPLGTQFKLIARALPDRHIEIEERSLEEKP